MLVGFSSSAKHLFHRPKLYCAITNSELEGCMHFPKFVFRMRVMPYSGPTIFIPPGIFELSSTIFLYFRH